MKLSYIFHLLNLQSTKDYVVVVHDTKYVGSFLKYLYTVYNKEECNLDFIFINVPTY